MYFHPWKILDRFKDCCPKEVKMHLATIRFVRDGHDERDDDMLRIYDTDCNDLFRITFTAVDMRKPSQFFATRHWALEYISEILHTLTHDTDPFESIQVETAIHPSVLYHVSDLDEPHIRQLVESTIDSVLRRTVVKVDEE
jgi:hypothetical protein